MKFLFTIAALAVAGVAAEPACEADYIVTTCLGSETAKVSACPGADWDCLCHAHEAVATCYNNCPNDVRAAPARQQVGVYCGNAKLYGTEAQASKTASKNAAAATSPANTAATQTGTQQATGSATTSGPAPQKTGAASALNAGGAVIAGLAGIVAALL